MQSLIYNYNEWAKENKKPEVERTGFGGRLIMACKVAFILDRSYGKVGNEQSESLVTIEQKHFPALLANYFHDALKEPKEFGEWLSDPNSDFHKYGGLAQIAQSLVMTLPTPRYAYYESSDFDVIQKQVTEYANHLVDDLGFYPITASLNILEDMEGYSAAVLFMGLIFDIIILLFVIIAILLIHSLLMISVETKTFEIGVMRMIGLSKQGIMMMVII